MGNKKAIARERVKALREEQARKDRRKEQLMRFGVVGAVLAAVALVVAAVALSSGDDDAPLVLPAAATEDADHGGVQLAGANPDAPTFELWFDLSCPGCAALEATSGELLAEMAENGEVNLVERPTTIIGGARTVRKANAWACAIDEGLDKEFMNALYANPQSNLTNRNLIDLGESLGIDSREFRSCVNDGTYIPWVSASTAYGSGVAGINGTPTGFLNGQMIDGNTLLAMSPDDVRVMIEAAGEDTESGGDDADDVDDGDDADGEDGGDE